MSYFTPFTASYPNFEQKNLGLIVSFPSNNNEFAIFEDEYNFEV